MTKKTEIDPFALSIEENKKFKEEAAGQSQGLFCNKKNVSLSGSCDECDTVQQLFKANTEEDKNAAYARMAKVNFYANIILKANPSKSIILEMGKKAGNTIIAGISDNNWGKFIAHPLEGKGRDLLITKKFEDGFNKYSPEVSLEPADWSVDVKNLEPVPNLDNIIEILQTGSHEVLKISSLSVDETLAFRLCQPWDNGDDNKRVLAVVWRHWGADEPAKSATDTLSTESPGDSGTPELSGADVVWDDSDSSDSSDSTMDDTFWEDDDKD